MKQEPPCGQVCQFTFANVWDSRNIEMRQIVTSDYKGVGYLFTRHQVARRHDVVVNQKETRTN